VLAEKESSRFASSAQDCGTGLFLVDVSLCGSSERYQSHHSKHPPSLPDIRSASSSFHHDDDLLMDDIITSAKEKGLTLTLSFNQNPHRPYRLLLLDSAQRSQLAYSNPSEIVFCKIL